MLHLLRPAMTVAALGYLAVCVILFVFQRSLIYYPTPDSSANTAAKIVLPNVTARVLVSTRAATGPHAVLYFGGNAEDVSFNMPDLSEAFPQTAIYLMHYRGYGGSSGKPTEEALFSDALALFDLVYASHPNVQVIGRSLGSGVAVHLASRRPVDRLVLVTPFNSLEEVAASQFHYFPVRWLMRDTFDSWRYAPSVNAPTLIIEAQNDEVVPRASTEALLTHFKSGVASLTVIPGAGHNSISDNPGYWRLLAR